MLAVARAHEPIPPYTPEAKGSSMTKSKKSKKAVRQQIRTEAPKLGGFKGSDAGGSNVKGVATHLEAAPGSSSDPAAEERHYPCWNGLLLGETEVCPDDARIDHNL